MKRVTPRPRQASTASAPSDSQQGFPFAAKEASTPLATAVQQEIFSATESLLQTKSLGDLTVADILTAADVSRTTFYRYFTSKHMVVSAMLTASQAELLDVMRPWSTRGDRPAEEALWEAMEAVAKVWGRHRPMLRAISESWHSEPEIGRQWVAVMDHFVNNISRQIDRERKAGMAPEGVDSRQLARHLAWGGERMLYLAGFGICGPEFEDEVVEPMVAIWVGAIYKR